LILRTIRAHSGQEQVNSTEALDLLLVRVALGFEVGSIAVEDVDIFFRDVNVVEEILTHERVVGLRMGLWQSYTIQFI
jgi:hypothetical protein